MLTFVLLGFAVLLVVGILVWLKWRYGYWVRRGVVGPKPEMFFGHLRPSMTAKMTESEVVQCISATYEDAPVVGIFQMWQPVLLIRDFRLVRKLFNHKDLVDHPPLISEATSDYAFYSLLTMFGDTWKTRRQLFNKLFTPRHVRTYISEMQADVDRLVPKLKGEVECMELMARFTAETMVRLMYGVDISCTKGRSAQIVKVVHSFIHPDLLTISKVILHNNVPWLFRLLDVGVMPLKTWDFAVEFYRSLVQARGGQQRDDVLGLVLQLQSDGSASTGKISYKEAVGHVFQFLVGAIHPSSVALSHILFKLAEYPDVQEKAYKEVETVLKGTNNIGYQQLAEMKYLDCVIAETLRLIPLMGVLKRVCARDCELDDGLPLAKDTEVWVDAFSQQKDPAIFPRPEEFLPERWASGEAEQAAYLPFGKGPRLCIGIRLAEMQLKLVLAAALLRFQLSVGSRTRSPFKFDPKAILLSSAPVGGIWVDFKPRSIQTTSTLAEGA